MTIRSKPHVATMDLYRLQRQLGGFVYDGGRRWIGPGPNHSRKDASLSVMIASDGRPLVHSFAGDPFADCASWLGLRCDDARPMDSAARAKLMGQREAAARRREAETREFVAGVWRGTQPIEGTAAEAYLFRRGVIIDGCDDVRFHPEAPRSWSIENPKRRHAAMVGLVRDAKGLPSGLHVTFITADGRKAFGRNSRLMFGPVSGGAVRLAPMGSDGALGVAEGIETSGAFGAIKGVPTWATLSTSGLQRFVLPVDVRRLLIAADSDDGGAGLAAARILAERAQWRCDVEIHPAPDGQDWADVGERTA